MGDAQNIPAEGTSAEMHPAEGNPAENSAPADSSGKAPKWDGEFDPERAARLVENLRGDNESLKKKLAELSAKLGEKEEAEKTEFQRLQERAEKAERELQNLRTEALVMKAARKHGIPDELIEFITGSSEEEIESRAERLAQHMAAKKTADLPGKPKPKLVPGDGGGESGAEQLTREDLSKMTPEEIRQARREGRLDAVLGK